MDKRVVVDLLAYIHNREGMPYTRLDRNCWHTYSMGMENIVSQGWRSMFLDGREWVIDPLADIHYPTISLS